MFLIARNILAAYRAMALEFRQLAVFVVVVVVVVVFVLGVCACGNERRRALQCGANAWLLGWVKKCRTKPNIRQERRQQAHACRSKERLPLPSTQRTLATRAARKGKGSPSPLELLPRGQADSTIFFKSAS